MSKFVLVHGSWHGAWCWDALVPLLQAKGHAVSTPDLPAHGADHTPVADVTLQSYVDCVREVVDAATEPVVLVGHSMGGVVISGVAESHPDRIKRLVYVAGFLLQDGETLLQLGQADAESLVLPNLQPSTDQSYATLRDGALDDIFYHDCDPAVASAAKARLTPEPLRPVVTPLRITSPNFGRVPRAYVLCEHDHAITLGAQRRMLQAMPCAPVVSLPSSHSPFYSMPQGLVDALAQLA